MIPLPGIDVSACGSTARWTSQVVTADTNGRFDTTWAPNEPNTMRVAGTATDTAFNATLNCVSGNGSGSMAATGGGGTYQGTFNFNAQRGSITRRNAGRIDADAQAATPSCAPTAAGSTPS